MRTGLVIRCVLALAVVLSAGASAGEAQSSVVRGRLHLVWDAGTGPDGIEYLVQPLDGRAPTRLRVTEAQARDGRLVALDRRDVEVSVEAIAALRAAPGPAEARLLSIRPLAAAPAIASASALALDFVTVMCKFADDASEPFTATSLAVVHGGTRPGLAFHYREMAGDATVMTGSVIKGWYTLPLPRSSYVFSNGANYTALAQDCAQAADPEVDYSQYAGVNLQLNGAMQTRPTPPYDTLSLGGSATLLLDGQYRNLGVTWLSGIHASNYVVVHHEVGHAVGWPHSSGDYGQEYDSNWDIMSRGYLYVEPGFGWRGIHTIGPHKAAKGWIAGARLLEPAMGTITKVKLARSAMPPPDGVLMIRVPWPSGGWLTAETRMPIGLDFPLPAPAVLLHRVKFGIRSYVVDPDLNSNPNDAAAQWTPGEQFRDDVAGFALRVDSAAADGFFVTVTRGWAVQTVVLGDGEVEITAPGREPERCDADCTSLLGTAGALVRFEAFPDAGRAFLGWSGACTGLAVCEFPVSAATTVTARFGGPSSITTSTLGAGLMGHPYSDSLKVVHDGGAGVWSVATGTLPPGLTLNATTGRLTGTPSAAGAYAFTLRVTTGPFQAEQATSIAVTKPVLTADAVVAMVISGTPLGAGDQAFLDLLGNRNGRVDVGDVRAWLQDAGALSPAAAAAVRAALAGGRR